MNCFPIDSCIKDLMTVIPVLCLLNHLHFFQIRRILCLHITVNISIFIHVGSPENILVHIGHMIQSTGNVIFVLRSFARLLSCSGVLIIGFTLSSIRCRKPYPIHVRKYHIQVQIHLFRELMHIPSVFFFRCLNTPQTVYP